MDTIILNMENLSEVERKQLLSLVEKANKHKRFCLDDMRDKEIFFFLGPSGDVREKEFISGNTFDENKFLLGNAFPTREAAEFEVERRKVIHEIKEFIAENDDKEIDWTDKYTKKYSLYYDAGHGRVSHGTTEEVMATQKEFYSSSMKIIDDMIETIGKERIKKYYFGITE